jgi:putative PIN family toxin of toxin-antitoxin system
LKALFDSNVIIAAFLTEGLCSKLLRRAARGHFKLLVSESVISEVKAVLGKKAGLTNREVAKVLDLVRDAVHEVGSSGDPKALQGTCRDPDDDHVLSSALSLGVDVIVTGDKDLLEIQEFRGIKILAPRDFELFFAELDV